MAISGPRSFPPSCRGRPFVFRSVSTRCLVSEASRFPAGFSPAPLWLLPQQSPIRHIAPNARFHWPVGIIVVFLRRARRSRVGAGWGGPRIVCRHWWPVDRQTMVAAFFEPCAWESSECKPGAGRDAGSHSIPDFPYSARALLSVEKFLFARNLCTVEGDPKV